MFKSEWDMVSGAPALPGTGAISEAASSPATDTLPLRLSGRYMLADRSEHACETLAVGLDEIEFKVSQCGAVGERVIAYVDELGRIEGRIAGLAAGSFRLAPRFLPAKRERILRKIAWLHERQEGRAAEGRRHERIDADPQARVEIVVLDGRREAKVIDYSRSGVALQTDAPLKIGDALLVGGVKAQIVRSGPGFLAAKFDELQHDGVASIPNQAA